MTSQTSSGSSVLAQAVVLASAALILLGLFWYGVSGEVFKRQWQDFTGRPSGPMSFRFILQPTMAMMAALHDGINDARLGRSPYFWTVLTNAQKRPGRLREGIISTARIVLLGLVMDAIYQFKVLGTFYPAEAVIIAVVLAFVPYLLIRGPVARIARRWCAQKSREV
ncbi:MULTISPECIES: hypothetical protein [unclassified Hyphomicrobium]|uniref:hypothetical protein n=1 Tax=unclassified Hyphomicrobium TaxID=2619925 RepID=UPI000213D3BE|nr:MULTISPECIES: hypothetical protein [unclassified Hyphomicrobium]CCB66835.1 conserved membrane protein of unknown function [Hyphomicrobium sp. MC1]